MTPISVLIVDDEPLARRRIARLIEHSPGLSIVGTAGSADEARSLLDQVRPDLLLLDIQMPGTNPFDMLQALDQPPLVIFVTAFDHQSLRAFDINAVDYVTKPIDPARLTAAISRAQTRLAAARAGDQLVELRETLRSLRTALGQQPDRAADLWVSQGQVRRRLLLEEISRIEAERDYSRVYANGQAFLMTESLSALQRQLPADQFLRIHRSTMIRRGAVVAITRLPFNGMALTLADGSQARVGRTYLPRVRAALLSPSG